jgi:hypothetical protein
MTTRDHGHVNTYKAGCRCAACREANRLYQQAATARRAANPVHADIAGHGRASTYSNYKCRCDACRRANSKDSRRTRQRRKERAA